MIGSPPLLSVQLSVDYRGKAGVLKNLTLEVRRGEVLGLIGESGSGKSTLALAILKLLELKGGSASGEITFDGQDLMRLSEPRMREIRGRRISLILQSPLTALNPALRIGTQLSQAWRAHAAGDSEVCAQALTDALRAVSLPADTDFLRRYPSQLSVGQAQRVLIAMAILHRPELLICDEPTSALDAITQSEILQLFARLNQELGMALLYISHDLLSVSSICNRIAILQGGQIVECSDTQCVFSAPEHPYTRQVIASLPANPWRALEPETDRDKSRGATAR